MESNKILSADLLDIVFEGKNKDYGAYELRRTYNKRIVRALIITAAVAALALLGSILFSSMAKGKKKEVIRELNIQNITQKEKKIEAPPPPPPKPPDPPKVKMEQFTPPVVKKDEDVIKPPPPVTKLDDAKIGDDKQKGIDDNGVPDPPKLVDEKKVVEDKKPEEDDNKIFDKVEIEASFPGGDGKWRQYLERNCNGQVATDGGAPEGTYTTIVQFVVDKEGNISDVRALTNHGFGMEQEAIRAIQKGPKWNAAIQNGHPVKAYRRQPITFQVQGE